MTLGVLSSFVEWFGLGSLGMFNLDPERRVGPLLTQREGVIRVTG